jgi:hypothetical protein
MKTSLYLLALSLCLSSCATLVNLDNNKSLKMGIDVVTEKPDPIVVTVNGKEAKYKRHYEGGQYYVDWATVKKPKRELQVTVTQNNVTRSATIIGNKTKGLAWFTGLWVLLDHANGTLRQFPAVVFEDMKLDQAKNNTNK